MQTKVIKLRRNFFNLILLFVFFFFCIEIVLQIQHTSDFEDLDDRIVNQKKSQQHWNKVSTLVKGMPPTTKHIRHNPPASPTRLRGPHDPHSVRYYIFQIEYLLKLFKQNNKILKLKINSHQLMNIRDTYKRKVLPKV